MPESTRPTTSSATGEGRCGQAREHPRRPAGEPVSRRAPGLRRGTSGRADHDPAAHGPAAHDRAGLAAALDVGSLELHYQPQASPSGRPVGTEALLRPRGRDGRTQSPVPVVERAECTGLMPRLTQYVLDAALARAAAWYGTGLALPVAVNVPPTAASAPGFPAAVRDGLRRYGLPGRMLTVELTEGADTRDVPALAAALDELRTEGVRVSLDDFGTGYSSIARLRQLPVDELKIDRSFVARIADDPRDAAIVRCSVDLARCLGLDVVAEGVETEAQLALLAGWGVGAVQGWWVSRALPAAAATAWLRRAAALR
ncbi:EAL domain-containing protein [Streptomyces bambusae]|uniref:EAL domain-containing protein n=1 Tax=Streptomyces bambusae TaxID=1550616 RepID=UPI001CFCB371|nr:EAL domain-containing protein [Streptomyces bambusae]MCB5167491.1 EAL domain-containing protein [Streptomyces bambusae]